MKKSGCPVWQCETSDNRSDVLEYDAIVFHLRTWTINDLPERRSQNQRYVLWSLESAAWFTDTIRMANFFNWTMTYRWDSDIVGPYGYIAPTGDVPLHPSEDEIKFYLSKPTTVNYAQGKTKMAAWFVSNCNSASSRNEMVKILRKYIDVDVYGNCEILKCPKAPNVDYSSEDCREMAARKYKFYLSLENSLCRNYITEKYENMLIGLLKSNDNFIILFHCQVLRYDAPPDNTDRFQPSRRPRINSADAFFHKRRQI
jgi:hypothetical protein